MKLNFAIKPIISDQLWLWTPLEVHGMDIILSVGYGCHASGHQMNDYVETLLYRL